MNGYVYVLRSQDGYFKIGCSANWEHRVRTISSSLPNKPKLVLVLRTGDMRATEKAIHRFYSRGRTNGEWFRLYQGDVTSLLGWAEGADSVVYPPRARDAAASISDWLDDVFSADTPADETH